MNESRTGSVREVEVVIDQDGTTRFIHDDDILEALRPALPSLQISRAGHVEPAPSGSGWVVRLEEAFADGDSGQLQKAFTRRDDALAAEREAVLRSLRGLNRPPFVRRLTHKASLPCACGETRMLEVQTQSLTHTSVLGVDQAMRLIRGGVVLVIPAGASTFVCARCMSPISVAGNADPNEKAIAAAIALRAAGSS